MKTPRIHRQTGELGTVWFMVPLLWAAVALVGCALIANWPDLFVEEPSARATASAKHATAPVTPEEQP